MTTHDETVPELPDEALGKAPGRGRLTGRRILVVGARSARFQGESAPLTLQKVIRRGARRKFARCSALSLLDSS